jgi:hypothetical protein
LPPIYSSEIDTIDKTIYSLIKESVNETSYSKMQEYKQRINSYINKRAGIIGELSPDGAEIKELIEKRNNYEAQAKKSNDNILSPITGLVSYKTDGLEDKLTLDRIDNLSYSVIETYVDEDIKSNTTEIKVVNNYEAYIVTKVGIELKEYIKKGYDYDLRLVENNNEIIEAELSKVSERDDGYELYFKVTNGIENIIDYRTVGIEVVWNRTEGLAVLNSALKESVDGKYKYVTLVYGGQYIDIPIKIINSDENISIVENYTNEELKEIGVECNATLSRYDIIVIE